MLDLSKVSISLKYLVHVLVKGDGLSLSARSAGLFHVRLGIIYPFGRPTEGIASSSSMSSRSTISLPLPLFLFGVEVLFI